MERRILLVEDNPDDEHIFLMAMRQVGIRADVVVARDGGEALSVLRSPAADRFDLVLLDLKMPKVGGLEVLAKLREGSQSVRAPIVVFTSSTHDRDVGDAYRLGASSYVRKPVDFQDYRETVRSLLQYWLAVNQGASDVPGPLRKRPT